jgi:hypothetical protein
MKEVKKRLIVVIAALILLLLLFEYKPQPTEFVTNKTFVTYSDLFFNYEISKYPSRVEIAKAEPAKEKITIGLTVDPWNLDFGIIPEGKNFGTRFINLANLKEKDAKINFKVYGNISPFVKFSKNNFILHPNENLTVEVSFHAEGAKIGNYFGEIDVVVQRPKYDFLYAFWR